MDVCPATSHGFLRGNGVSIVPNLIRSVVIAAAANIAHASSPQIDSQTKNPSQPCSSARPANSAAVRASP